MLRSRGYIEDFIRPLERTGRLITPTFDDWLELTPHGIRVNAVAPGLRHRAVTVRS
jgi:hypothetical protein